MREDRRTARMREIEAVAYDLFAQHGFEGTSMLAVAKAAKASNETLYRWYGDKAGLFQSMVQANASDVREVLEAAIAERGTPMQVLERVAPALLAMLLGDRAILLNRAAASDPGGALGRLLAASGRDAVLPLIEAVLKDAVQAGALKAPDVGEIGPLLVHLLVGDRQIRRVIGTMAAPSDAEVQAMANSALAQFRALCAP